MRNIRFAACTLILFSILAGCRQTSGPTAGSPLTPIGPLAPVGLSPIGAPPASASSAMGSLSAPTRVPPPPSNSANTQAGAFVPYGQTSSIGQAPQASNFNNQAYAVNPSAFGAMSSNSPIGSGVAPAGWTETNANVPRSNVPHSIESTASGIRFNGMQVNDLTRSAVTTPSYPASNSVQGPAVGQPVQAAFNQGYYAPAVDPVSPPTIPTNPNFQAAQRFEQPPMSPPPSSQGPSTEPIGPSGSSADDSLPWRRPGTTY